MEAGGRTQHDCIRILGESDGANADDKSPIVRVGRQNTEPTEGIGHGPLSAGLERHRR
jgi:hypothetical protein